MGNVIVFGALAVVALVSAIMMIASRNAVHSALWLVLNFTAIAILYLVLNAPFIAMVQITVYAGAIMVLFLFVIMLLGAEQLRGVGGVAGSERWHRIVAGLLGAALIIVFGYIVLSGDVTAVDTTNTINSDPVSLGLRLFEAYVFPFEVTGVLLIAAIIGVAVFSRSKKKEV